MSNNKHSESSTQIPPILVWNNLPQSLRERPQWTLADDEKAPRQVDGRHASSTDATTWTDFETASRAAQLRGCHIGFMLSAGDPFTCIDLDVKPDTPQERRDEFLSLIDYFDSYTEHSRSGVGYHVWVEGKVPQGYKRDGIEVYADKRFMICTGNVVRPKPIRERQKILDTFVGNWQKNFQSQSEADLSFVTRLVQMSGLAREKTFKNLPRTVAKAGAILEADAVNDAYHLERGRVFAENLLMNWKGRRRLLVMHDADLLRMPPARWIIRDIIPEEGLVTIYGQPKTGKTFLSLDMLAAIANAERGSTWFGKRVRRAHCVYVPFEGRAGIPDRVRAWIAANKGKTTGIHFIMDPKVNLRDQDGRDRLVETIVDNGWTGGVVEIDTLARAAGAGFVENASEGMGEMIAIFDELQRRLGGVIAPVHHSRKETVGSGPRGHSSLSGAVEIGIETSKDENGLPVFTVALAKDAEMDVPIPFTLDKVWVRNDVDEDGIEDLSQPIFSLVVRERISRPAKDAATKSAEDDDFIDTWIRKEVIEGSTPSKRSLESQLAMMKPERSMSRDGVRQAVNRLLAAGRLQEERSGGRGAQAWLRPIDRSGP